MKQRGFTLIELSIVLVIIGLLVGGVLVGRDLIEAARLRSIVSGHQEFTVRWQTFKMKYNCFAGDCPNATQFFGLSGGCPSPTITATCNGNGDGWIHWSMESMYVWSHFHLSSFSDYEAHRAPSGAFHGIHQTYYALAPNRKDRAGWLLGSPQVANKYADMYPSAANDNNGSNLRGTAIQTAGANTAAHGYAPIVVVERPDTVRQLDIKIDDGIPANGKLRASGGMQYDTNTRLTCITGSNETSAYDLTQTEATCRYLLILQ